MSEQRRRLCENINSRLDEMEDRIQQVREGISAASMKIGRAVHAKLDEAKRRAEMRNRQFQQERAQVNLKVKRDLEIAQEKLEGWKASRDAEKLSRHAENAEQHALAAIIDACDAMDEAELASLQALEARMTADAAANEGSA
jgi:tetrahydromethanopterin S-methyltransferase subunit G